jgi:hypothetical protein
MLYNGRFEIIFTSIVILWRIYFINKRILFPIKDVTEIAERRIRINPPAISMEIILPGVADIKS